MKSDDWRYEFEESSLTGYLVKNLEPLTEADPVILADYVAALLKNDKPTNELQKLCTENLVDFLGQDTKSFIAKLFQALEEGSFVASAERPDKTAVVESSSALSTVDPVVENSSPKPEKNSSSGRQTDPEEKEASEDDDDDRNHKHRRRDTRSPSPDKDMLESFQRRISRKREKPYENGQMFLGSDPQSSDLRKEQHFGALDSVKSEKRRHGMGLLPRIPQDIVQRSKGSPGFGAPRVDLGRIPLARGRGRSSIPWGQHDSRFASVDKLDFASQMVAQGSSSSLFAANMQGASWGPFGLVGMPSTGLDALHPLGLPGALRQPINPSLNLGVPRQRCRDFEERGFCLNGDMCPMEHGLNRIVVEDVQSLSQFNLPVSLPNARMMGVQSGPGTLAGLNAPSSLSSNSKASQSKVNKSGVVADSLGLNGVLFSSGATADTDLYDPDQPLWSNNRPETSAPLSSLCSPKMDEPEPSWKAEPAQLRQRSEQVGKPIIASQNASSSVWGRIGNSGEKVDHLGPVPAEDELNEEQPLETSGMRDTLSKVKHNHGEMGAKVTNFTAGLRSHADSARKNTGRASQKASRTLFVNGIPLKNNKKDALLSHFRKFGEVIDIHIPHNSERAFVQFATREEAEAALRAPDAVMGNRFIKLWWANRDSIPDGHESSGNAFSVAPHSMTLTATPSGPSVDKEKEDLISGTPKAGTTMTNSSIPLSVSSHKKSLLTSGPKMTPPSQKKLETLEILKEELRKKQEMLEQKRNDFRRQLDQFEKQAITPKGEAGSDQIVKRHKVDAAAASTKAASSPSTPKHNLTAVSRLEAHRMLNNNYSSGETTTSANSLEMSSFVDQQQSLHSLKQPSRLSGPPFLVNRFKLDNRPMAFRILPPLPPNLVNVAALREHFSSFGDLSVVEIEEPEGEKDSNLQLETYSKCSACIHFTSRRSAEKAFYSGRIWQGHNLQFTWVMPSNTSVTTDSGGVENSPNNATTPRRNMDVEMRTPESSFTSKAKSSGPKDAKAAGSGTEQVEPTKLENENDRHKNSGEDPGESLKHSMEGLGESLKHSGEGLGESLRHSRQDLGGSLKHCGEDMEECTMVENRTTYKKSGENLGENPKHSKVVVEGSLKHSVEKPEASVKPSEAELEESVIRSREKLEEACLSHYKESDRSDLVNVNDDFHVGLTQ